MVAISIVGLTMWITKSGFKNVNTASVSSDSEISLKSEYGILTVEEARFDFGIISMKNGDVSHVFEIKNDGAEPVIIEKIYTSCMCTIAYITDSSGKRYGGFGMPGHGLFSGTNIAVRPGESATVEAIFDPKAHGPSGVGLAERSIYLETNSVKLPKLELSFRATVVR